MCPRTFWKYTVADLDLDFQWGMVPAITPNLVAVRLTVGYETATQSEPDGCETASGVVVVDVLLTIRSQFDSYVILYKMQAIQHCKKIQYQQHTHKNRQ